MPIDGLWVKSMNKQSIKGLWGLVNVCGIKVKD